MQKKANAYGVKQPMMSLENIKSKKYLGVLFFVAILFIFFYSSAGSPQSSSQSINHSPRTTKPFPPFPDPNGQEPKYSVSIVETFFHDPKHFTQGFEIVDGFLYEGTGMNGESVLAKKNLRSGSTLKSVRLDSKYFGEGITVFQGRIYQITWKSRIGFIYDQETFELLGNWTYNYDGWGLTHDDRYLIMSDGTSVIRFLDPKTLLGSTNVPSVREIAVNRFNKQPLININELEYIDGKIWANVWLTTNIVVINPSNGLVVATIDSRKLKNEVNGGDVLNGIAYDHDTNRLYVTGKYWDKMFEIIVVPPQQASSNPKRRKV